VAKSPTLQVQPPIPVSGPSTPAGDRESVEKGPHEHTPYLADWEYSDDGQEMYEVWRCRSEQAVSETTENPDHDKGSALAKAIKSVDGVDYDEVVPPVLPGRTIWPGEPDHPHGEVCGAEARVLHDADRDAEFTAASKSSKTQAEWYDTLAPKLKDAK